MRIGCLGEVMLELVPGAGDAATLGVAGDTYNTAVYMAHMLGPDVVDYITVLGCDGFSDRIRDHMTKFRVGADRIVSHPTRIPGLYAIETDDEGERRFTYWRSEAAARTLGDDGHGPIDPLFEGLTHLFYSGISLAILPQASRDRLFDAIARFRAGGGIVAFDSNYRPRLWDDADLARHETTRAWEGCDIALPSVDDEMALFGDVDAMAVRARFQRYGITQGALKRAARGPLRLDGADGDQNYPVAKVVDSTAAGDSFNAGFLAALMSGQGHQSACDAGHALASKVVGKRGAIVF